MEVYDSQIISVAINIGLIFKVRYIFIESL